MLTCGWLTAAQASPLHEYFLYHRQLPNLWLDLNLPAFLLAIALGSGVHGSGGATEWLIIALQWLLVSMGTALAFDRVSERLRRMPPARRGATRVH